MKGMSVTVDVTGLDVFSQMLDLLKAILEDPNVPQTHKDTFANWVDMHKREYHLD